MNVVTTPFSHLAASFMERPATNAFDFTGLLSKCDKFTWGNIAQYRVGPARQCLNPIKLAIFEPNLRLVVQV